jgi:hypothetical protein
LTWLGFSQFGGLICVKGAGSGETYFWDDHETGKHCRNFAKLAGTQLSPDLHSGLGVGRKHLCKHVFNCGGHIDPISPRPADWPPL